MHTMAMFMSNDQRRIVGKLLGLGPARQGVRTVSGPEGSSTKGFPLGAVGKPGPSSMFASHCFSLTTMTHKTLRYGILAALVVILGAAFISYLWPPTVTISVNGVDRRVRTHAETVREALIEADVIVDPEDEVWPPLDTNLKRGTTITIQKAHAVAVRADGELRQIRTQQTHPLALLAEQGIHTSIFDEVVIDGKAFSPEWLEDQSWSVSPQSVRVVRSAAVRVEDQGRILIIRTTQADVGRALNRAGVRLYLADAVSPALSTPISDGMTVTIERSIPVTIIADGRQLATRVRGTTVGDALAMIGIAPIGQDYTIPALDAALQADMVIEVVRVVEYVLTEQDTIPYETIYQPDPALSLDEERVIQNGVDGTLEREIWVRYENGKEVSRTVQQEVVTTPPVPCLIASGKLGE